MGIYKKYQPWIIWALGAAFFAYEFLLQVSPSVMVHDLMKAFSVNAAALGNLTAFYLYAYCLMQLPVGILLDRFGARRLLTLSGILCAIGALLFGTAENFYIASFGRFFIGLGSSFAVVSAMHLTATWLPLNRFALMIGIMLGIGFLGAVGGQAPLSIMVHAIGWRNTLITFSVVGLILAILIWTLVRDRSLSIETHHEIITKHQFFSGLKYVARNAQTWIIAIFSGLMYLPTPALAGLWGVPFLTISYHLHPTTAALIISMTYIGYAFGSPFFGWLSDRMGKRRLPMIMSGIATLLTLLGILYLPPMPLLLMGICLFAFGFFSSSCFIAFSLAREINPPSVNATVLGFVNMLNTLGGALAQPFIGFLLDLYWQGKMEDGVRLFSTHDYHRALATLPICVGLALLLTPFIKESNCQPRT